MFLIFSKPKKKINRKPHGIAGCPGKKISEHDVGSFSSLKEEHSADSVNMTKMWIYKNYKKTSMPMTGGDSTSLAVKVVYQVLDS